LLVQQAMKKFHSLKLKIIFPLLVILLVVFLASSLVIIDRESKEATVSLLNTATSFSSLSAAYIIANYEILYDSGFYKLTEVIDDLIKLDENLVEIQIVDVNGKILFDSTEIEDGKYDEDILGDRFLENETLVQRVGDSSSSFFLDENARRIDIIEPYFDELSGRHDYSIRYIFSLASLDSKTNEMIITISLYSGVFIIISFLLIFFLFNFFVSAPVGELTKGVRIMGKETLGYEVKIKSKDEIGELAAAFNRMSADLKVSQDNLEEYSKNLEKLVAERTKELEEKTQRLEQINKELTVAQEELSVLNKNLEERVYERTKEVEKLLKQKDEFITQLGHDLKNPLGPLINLIPLLEEQEDDTAKKEMLAVLHRNANYMKNLVVKTLELASLNSPNTRFSLEQLRLFDEVDYIIENKKILFEENKTKVSNNINRSLSIRANRLRFEELLTNIFENSVKYCEKDCRITIDAEQTNDFVTISVTDNGIGMTKEEIESIFDEFYKADSARRDIQNTGLGLSICKRIVEKHGGRIWVESPGPGKGTTVFFTMPAESSPDT
jgi:signal transduction histidine kinase